MYASRYLHLVNSTYSDVLFFRWRFQQGSLLGTLPALALGGSPEHAQTRRGGSRTAAWHSCPRMRRAVQRRIGVGGLSKCPLRNARLSRSAAQPSDARTSAASPTSSWVSNVHPAILRVLGCLQGRGRSHRSTEAAEALGSAQAGSVNGGGCPACCAVTESRSQIRGNRLGWLGGTAEAWSAHARRGLSHQLQSSVSLFLVRVGRSSRHRHPASRQ